MKGDFSSLRFDPKDNFSSVLQQQGRVLLDSDWNAQAQILDWRLDSAARDAIGPRVAATPAGEPDGFRVQSAEMMPDGRQPAVILAPGRIWADGLLVCLDGQADQKRFPTYLAPIPNPANPEAGRHDAVVLEVWSEVLNGFQDPEQLIECALGGPDTTERLQTVFDFRLLRLKKGDGCRQAREMLDTMDQTKGTLSVSLRQPTVVAGDCPLHEGGGYTGFEHYLYRIEVAATDYVSQRFKWSRFNGGLVGRGTLNTSSGHPVIDITANLTAITTSGLNQFYLEILTREQNRDHWRVIHGAPATLVQDQLTLGAAALSGTLIDGESVFFRLWDGLEELTAFPTPAAGIEPNPLGYDGILLSFDSWAGTLTAGDYWVFEVRAGEIEQDQDLLVDAPPRGPVRHRVPLAVIVWQQGLEADGKDHKQIRDCRAVFRPLAELPQHECCLVLAPGENINRAVTRLREAGGGCICLLPGDHPLCETIDLRDARGIRIYGFGPATRVFLDQNFPPGSVVDLSRAAHIEFNDFTLLSRGNRVVFSCEDTVGLTMRNMLVYGAMQPGTPPIFTANKQTCGDWRLQHNLFLGRIGIRGANLADSLISDNRWLCIFTAIQVTNLVNVRISHNRFLGVPLAIGQNFDSTVTVDGSETGGGTKTENESETDDGSDSVAGVNTSITPEKALSRIESFLDQEPRASSFLVALRTSTAFELDFQANQVSGRSGLFAEVIGESRIRDNLLLTTVYGAHFGITHNLEFSANRIGRQAGPRGSAAAVACQVGLRLLADSDDLRVTANQFRNVEKGVQFISDPKGSTQVLDVTMGNLVNFSARTARTDWKGALRGAREIVATERRDLRLVNTASFRIARTERILINENLFNARRSAIEWTGSKQVVDFRIRDNAFIGCRHSAIRVEPDGVMTFIHEPVDTRVRLIVGNRFEIYAAAIFATIGAVRLENNDVRVLPSPNRPTSLLDAMDFAARTFYTSEKMAQGARRGSSAIWRLHREQSASFIKNHPNQLDHHLIAEQSDNLLPANFQLGLDPIADTLFTVNQLALDADPAELLEPMDDFVQVVGPNLDGFVVNLDGLDNRAIGNRILTRGGDFPSGILFHQLSGQVCDNRVAVSRTALLLAQSVAEAGHNVRISGNSLVTETSFKADGGPDTINYALRIQALNKAHLFINHNFLDGWVWIGAQPVTAHGFGLTLSDDGFTLAGLTTSSSQAITSFRIARSRRRGSNIPRADLNSNIRWENQRVALQTWRTDPHEHRPTLHIEGNRVLHGWMAVAQSAAGAYWSPEQLRRHRAFTLLANISNNIFDYSAKLVGYDLIITGNHSQNPIRYRVGNRIKETANLPDPSVF